MIGNECPECGKRLAVDGACSCGWRQHSAGSAKAVRECARCEKQRVMEVPGQPQTYPCEHCGAISSGFCHQCGARSQSTTPFRGARLCPTCRLTSVKAEASKATDLCTECGVPVSVHIAECRALVARIEARSLHL